jgi:hypothetical protein
LTTGQGVSHWIQVLGGGTGFTLSICAVLAR